MSCPSPTSALRPDRTAGTCCALSWPSERHEPRDWSRKRTAFLILQSVPGRPNTGGIYLYAENLQAFFWLRFDLKEDTLNADDFQLALRVYRLTAFIEERRRPSRRRHRRRATEAAMNGIVPCTVAQPSSGFAMNQRN